MADLQAMGAIGNFGIPINSLPEAPHDLLNSIQTI